jgi:hypothetical protein
MHGRYADVDGTGCEVAIETGGASVWPIFPQRKRQASGASGLAGHPSRRSQPTKARLILTIMCTRVYYACWWLSLLPLGTSIDEGLCTTSCSTPEATIQSGGQHGCTWPAVRSCLACCTQSRCLK